MSMFRGVMETKPRATATASVSMVRSQVGSPPRRVPEGPPAVEGCRMALACNRLTHGRANDALAAPD